jgi:hypothetical protein
VGVENSATSCLSILQKRRERSAQETAPDWFWEKTNFIQNVSSGKKSILSTFCRNNDNFVLQCLRIGSHFLKWQIVKSKYSHNLAENKIAPTASSETNNAICTKRALVIMCSCNGLVCSLVTYLCAVVTYLQCVHECVS